MNKLKTTVLYHKMNFIKRESPNLVDHWSEDSRYITFYQTHSFDENIKPVIVKKPLWLRIAELIIY